MSEHQPDSPRQRKPGPSWHALAAPPRGAASRKQGMRGGISAAAGPPFPPTRCYNPSERETCTSTAPPPMQRWRPGLFRARRAAEHRAGCIIDMGACWAISQRPTPRHKCHAWQAQRRPQGGVGTHADAGEEESNPCVSPRPMGSSHVTAPARLTPAAETRPSPV